MTIDNSASSFTRHSIAWPIRRRIQWGKLPAHFLLLLSVTCSVGTESLAEVYDEPYPNTPGSNCCNKRPIGSSEPATTIASFSPSVLVDTSDFPPRWRCGTWTAAHGWVHIISDTLIWGAYVSIPVLILYYVRRREDVSFEGIYWLFALFILSCGFGHLMEAVIFWWPAYRVAAMIKVVTVAASWLTVAAMIPILPRALAIPSVLRSNEILKGERQERERIIASLAEREARYFGIVNAAVDAVLTIDERGIIDSANKSTEKLFGWSVSELIGKNVSVLMPPPDAYLHNEYLANYCRTGEARIIGIGREVVALRRDGSTFPAELAVSEVRVGGRRLFTGIIRNITERRALERERANHIKQLRENNDNLARKNRELDEFTYVASHDLQEPLRKLTSFSQLLQEDAGTALSERAKKDLAFITNAADRMGMLIRDLLALSRAGRTTINTAPIAVSKCVQAALHNLSVCIEESGAKIEYADLPIVSGDSTMLTQLFQNLIGNAIKYRAKERSPLIRITSEQDGDQWQLSVSDNGIGMESQYFEQIFEPFKRLHGKCQYEGSGIGLSVCKKIVERHDGRIWVDSTPGEGSRFVFTLESGKEDVACKTECAQPLSC